MNMRLISGSAAAAALVTVLSIGAADAAMTPRVAAGDRAVAHVDCAAGFHIGPVGGCILGEDAPRHEDTVVDHRAADEGCETKTVRRTDDMGNSETRTRTNCN